VSRARTALHTILEGGQMPLRSDDIMPASEAFRSIMDDVDSLTSNGPSGG